MPRTSSRGSAAMARLESDNARCGRTAITTRGTAASSSWLPTTGITSRGRTRQRERFGSYVYDDYGRPLPADKLKDVQARIVTKESFDPATRKTTELSAFPLRVSRNRGYLEARVDTATLPAEMTAKVRFGRDSDEHRFDFTFDALTKEPAAPTSVPTARHAVTGCCATTRRRRRRLRHPPAQTATSLGLAGDSVVDGGDPRVN